MNTYELIYYAYAGHPLGNKVEYKEWECSGDKYILKNDILGYTIVATKINISTKDKPTMFNSTNP